MATINAVDTNYNSTTAITTNANNANTYNNIQADQQATSDQYLKNDIINISEEGSSTQTDSQNDGSFTHNYINAKNAYLNRSDSSKTEQNKQEDQNANVDENNDTDTQGNKLDNQEQQELDELKARNDEVVAHENQHKAVGGSLAQAPSYAYTTGPDGKRYITDGEVSIDIAEESDPQETISKMQKVRAAALAPAQPSDADRRVAAEASNIEAQARAQLNAENNEQINNTNNTDGTNTQNEQNNSSKQDEQDTQSSTSQITNDSNNLTKTATQLDAQSKSKM